MLTYADARRLADEYIREFADSTGVAGVTPKPYGWIFFYNGGAFVQTGDRSKMWYGNAPFVISRVDGGRKVLGTVFVSQRLAEYEKSIPMELMQMTPEPPTDGLRQIEFPRPIA